MAGNLRGGRRGSPYPRNSGSYDLFAYADLESLGLAPGFAALLQVKGNYNTNVNPDVEALSDPIDDADFDEPIYVAQLWAQRRFAGGRVRLRAGYLLAQTSFDRNAFANAEDLQFLSTALDNNLAVPLPVGLALTLFLEPTPWLSLAAAVSDADSSLRDHSFDTAFDGYDSLTGSFEAGVRVDLPGPGGPLPGNYRVGFFRDGSKKDVFGEVDGLGRPKRDRGHWGAYLSFDQVVFRESAESEQGLGLFARYGHADQDVNEVRDFWSVGFESLGLLPGRDADVLGVGVYQAIGSDRFRRRVDRDFDTETGVEVYYRIAVTRWLALTPDFQYIADPGGSDARDAVVLALRLRVAL